MTLRRMCCPLDRSPIQPTFAQRTNLPPRLTLPSHPGSLPQAGFHREELLRDYYGPARDAHLMLLRL